MGVIMKITIDYDSSINETEIHIKCASMNEQIENFISELCLNDSKMVGYITSVVLLEISLDLCYNQVKYVVGGQLIMPIWYEVEHSETGIYNFMECNWQFHDFKIERISYLSKKTQLNYF